MAYYTTEFGGQFDTYEEAREACLEDMDFDNLSEYLSYRLGYDELLRWALKQEKFFLDFENQFTDAEEEFCADYIHEWEDDEE